MDAATPGYAAQQRSESETGMEAVLHEASAQPPQSAAQPDHQAVTADPAGRPAANGTAMACRTLSHLPKREPVEVKFQDLNYDVSLGFRKGKSGAFRCAVAATVEWLWLSGAPGTVLGVAARPQEQQQ